MNLPGERDHGKMQRFEIVATRVLLRAIVARGQLEAQWVAMRAITGSNNSKDNNSSLIIGEVERL
jgi:hypothetical protein